MQRKKWIFLPAVILLCAVLVMVFLLKPVRVVWPYPAGVDCVDEFICLEKNMQAATAKRLYAGALTLVDRKLTALAQPPKVIFCSTEQCSRWFGLEQEAAFSVGTLGIIVSHRGWRDFYVAHEFIHHWQAEQAGNLRMLVLPAWLTEGMAYTLSDDPRVPLPGNIEAYRQEYRRWCKLNCKNNPATAFIKTALE